MSPAPHALLVLLEGFAAEQGPARKKLADVGVGVEVKGQTCWWSLRAGHAGPTRPPAGALLLLDAAAADALLARRPPPAGAQIRSSGDKALLTEVLTRLVDPPSLLALRASR